MKAKRIAITMDIAICADSDADVGSWSLLGFKSCRSAFVGSLVSFGLKSFSLALNEDFLKADCVWGS